MGVLMGPVTLLGGWMLVQKLGLRLELHRPQPAQAVPVRPMPTGERPALPQGDTHPTTAERQSESTDNDIDKSPAAAPTPRLIGPPPSPARIARRANNLLRLAKIVLKRNPPAAKRRLRDIVEKYPATDAAQEATQLLADLE